MMLRKDGIARRCDTLLQTQAELALGETIRRVESLGAHPELTKIVVALSELKDKIADFVEQEPNQHMSNSLLFELGEIKHAMGLNRQE